MGEMSSLGSVRGCRQGWAAVAGLALAIAGCTSGDDVDDGPGGGAGGTQQVMQPDMPGELPDPPPEGCEPGTWAECVGGAQCSDGSKQTAMCKEDGTYDVCVCPAVDDPQTGGTGGGTGGDTAVDSGTPTTTDAGGNSQAEPGATWAMMGSGPTNWYSNPDETTLSVDNAASLEEKWRATITGFPPGSPVIAEDKVFVLATGGAYAFDLESGEEQWSRDDLRGTGSFAYDDGFLYVHTYAPANLYKINASDGTTVWGPELTYDLSGCDGTSSAIVGGGAVVVGHSCGAREISTVAGEADAARGGVEAHDIETGAKLWSYFTVPEEGENGAMVWSSVAIDVDAGMVYASTGNNYTVMGDNSDAIHAIDLMTGDAVWVSQVRSGDLWSFIANIGGPDTDFGANPILYEQDGQRVVAAGDKGSAFWALDRDTGDVLWSREDLSASHNPAFGGVLMNGAYDGTALYAVANDADAQESVLHAMDPAAEGASLWEPKTFTGFAWGAPSVANGVLLVPIDDALHVLDAATGDELTSFSTGGTIAGGAAAVADGRVVVQSGLEYNFGEVTSNDQVICYGLP